MACAPLLSKEDLNRFRTKQCLRILNNFCEFGNDRCQYNHNPSWIRRSPFSTSWPTYLRYLPVCCPNMQLSKDGVANIGHCTLETECPFAHSFDEMLYHPSVYKTMCCKSYAAGSCNVYYCPFYHRLGERREPDKLKLLLSASYKGPPVPEMEHIEIVTPNKLNFSQLQSLSSIANRAIGTDPPQLQRTKTTPQIAASDSWKKAAIARIERKCYSGADRVKDEGKHINNNTLRNIDVNEAVKRDATDELMQLWDVLQLDGQSNYPTAFVQTKHPFDGITDMQTNYLHPFSSFSNSSENEAEVFTSKQIEGKAESTCGSHSRLSISTSDNYSLKQQPSFSICSGEQLCTEIDTKAAALPIIMRLAQMTETVARDSFQNPMLLQSLAELNEQLKCLQTEREDVGTQASV